MRAETKFSLSKKNKVLLLNLMKNFKIMKKISLLMTMLALFVIVFSACEPNSDPDQKPNVEDKPDQKPNVEDKIDIDVESATIFTSAL